MEVIEWVFSKIHQLRWDKRVEEFNKYLLIIDLILTINSQLRGKHKRLLKTSENMIKIHTEMKERSKNNEDMKKDVYKKIDLKISEWNWGNNVFYNNNEMQDFVNLQISLVEQIQLRIGEKEKFEKYLIQTQTKSYCWDMTLTE